MNWPLFFEVSGGVIGSLIAIPAVMVTIRTALDGHAPVWVPGDVAAAEARAAGEGWLHRSLGAFDIAFNVIVLRGQQGETISSHSYRAFLEGKVWGKVMNAWLGWFQSNHGAKAASGDLERVTAEAARLKKILGIN